VMVIGTMEIQYLILILNNLKTEAVTGEREREESSTE